MSRIITPCLFADQPLPPTTGSIDYGGYLADLSTETGRVQADICFSRYFRITSWEIVGSITKASGIGAGTDAITTTQAATIVSALGYGDEREFICLQDDTSTPTASQAFLHLQAAPSWAELRSDITNSGLFKISGDTAFCPFSFLATGPTTLATVGMGPISRTLLCGTVKWRVPLWPGSSGWNTLTVDIYTNTADVTADFTISGIESLPYDDVDGNAVWNTANAHMLLNPLTEDPSITPP